MSDSYISKLESLLTMLNDIIQTVPEAKKLLDSVGINTKDLEPTVKDSKTGEVIGRKSERQAQIRVEDAEEAIASNERLNQIIKERIALLQQEANAAKQANAVTTAAKPSGAAPRRSRSSTAKEPDLPGQYGITTPDTFGIYKGKEPSPKRSFVLPETSDVNALSKPEISQMRALIRSIAQKQTAAGSNRGAGLLQSIKPGSPVGAVVDAFEEALTTVVANIGDGFMAAGQQATERMGNIQSFRQVLGTVKQMVRKAVARPVVQRGQLSDVGFENEMGYGGKANYIQRPGSGDDDEGFGDSLTAGAEQRASGRARRRSLHNTWGKFKDSVKTRLGIRVGKGTNEDLRVGQDISRGYMESAATNQLFQEGVDYDITRAMDSILQNAIQDLRSGRVVSPTTNPAAAGTNLSSKIPKSIMAALSRFGPLVQGASTETTARGAIGREGKSLGVFGGPTAQNAFSGIFAAFLAEKLQASSGTSTEAQIRMLRGLNVKEIFQNLFTPDGATRKESETSLAGILHQRVKDELEKRVKRAEEEYAVAGTPESRTEAGKALAAARAEQRAYAKLDEKPTVVQVDPSAPTRRPTDATMTMKYSMAQSQLREDLKARYLTGTTTAQLVEQGVRTATTRAGGGYKPGQVIEIPEAPGTRYRVTSVEKPDFSTPEGIAAWEAKEGWSFKDLPDSIRKQVTNPRARQISFEPYKEEDTPAGPSSVVVQPARIVPADMIANPKASITGIENDPEEMITRVAGYGFGRDSFRDMVTNVRPVANRALNYLRRLGRADMPVLFDSPTPLQVIAQNNREGLPLDDGLESQLKVDEEIKQNKYKFTDSILAGFGLIGGSSKYQNFTQGLQTARNITDKDGKVDPRKARELPSPLSQLKNFFSSIQLLEQAEYSGFPILDYANAYDPKNPNRALALEMEAASPMLSQLSKRMLARVRTLSKSKEFKSTDSFGQFSMLSNLLRPVLTPALAEGGEDVPSVDTLVSAPDALRQNLPILHTSGGMADRIARVMGTTDDLEKSRQQASTVNPTSMAKTLRFRISSLARAILGRMPSPAYNDSVVQRHKREGIVDAGIREDLSISDDLAERQQVARDFNLEERPGEFTYRSDSYSAGENVNLEDEREKLDRILRAPIKDLTEQEMLRRSKAEEQIAAGIDPLGHLQSQSRQDNAVNYDEAAAMVTASAKPDERTDRSPLDQLVAKFQKFQGDNKGLKQLLATAIGDPKAREKALKLMGGVTPGMANMLRYTDFGDAASVESYLKAAAKDPKNKAMAEQISTFMADTKGHKYLENPAIAEMFNVATRDRPNEAVVEARQQAKEEDVPLARRLGPVIGKLRILQKLKDFGRQSSRDPSLGDTKFLSDMQAIFSVLAPEQTEQFRKMDTKNPEHVQSLTTTNAGRELVRQMRAVAQGLYLRHMRHPRAVDVEPKEEITKLTKNTPYKNVEFYVGSATENAQLLKRDTAVAEAKDKSQEDPKELFLERLGEEDRNAATAARDKENADRIAEVNAALDRKEFKEATEGKRRRYFGSNSEANQRRRDKIFKRLTRRVRPLAWWEAAKPVKRTKRQINALYRNSPEYLEAKQREKDAKQEAREAENMPVPEVSYGINPSVARGIPDFIKEFQEFDEPRVQQEVKDLEIMRERERERQLLEIDKKREADRLADQKNGQKAVDRSRRQRRKEINAALDSKPKKRSKRERKKILDRLTRNIGTYEQEDFGRDEKGNPLFFTKRERNVYAPIPGDEANNRKIMDSLREYYADRKVDAKYPIPKRLIDAWFQRENPPRGIDTAMRAQYGDPTRPEYVNKYGSLFGGAGIDPEVASIPPSNPKAKRGTAERTKTARQLWEARQQRRYATAKQLAVWNAEREGITDPAEKLAFADERVKRSEFANFDQVAIRGRRRIAEIEERALARETEAETATLPIVEKVQNRLNMEASGRFLLPAPDPTKPEEEYTKTAEQLAAEEPARKAAEAAKRRSESARRGVETKRRNARRKRIENAYTDYDAGAVVPPSTPEGIQLEDKRQKKIEEDRLNRRKARSMESKRRQSETNAKIAERERKAYLSDAAVARRARVAEERGASREAEADVGIAGIIGMKREQELKAELGPIVEATAAANAAEDAENRRLRDRRRNAAARFHRIHTDYEAGRGDRPRRQFNLPGPVPDTDPLRRPLSYVGQDNPLSRFQLFRQRMTARYRGLTNEGVDVGQMPLFPTVERKESATIAEERELRRQQIAENEQRTRVRIAEKIGEDRENQAESGIAAIRGSEREDNLDSALRPIQDENARRQNEQRVANERLRRRKAKSIESKRRQPQTKARVAAREEKQYMSEPAVARRAKIAEERRDKREQEAESQIRSIREVTRRREDAAIREEEFEGRLKYIRGLTFDARTASKQGASYQVPTYERQTPEIDNPAYLAAVEAAREKVNRATGLTESQKDAFLQKLIGKITVPKQSAPPISGFSKFKESTSKFFKDLLTGGVDEGSGTSTWRMFPDVGTGKNVLVRDTPRIARKRNESAERLADRSFITDAKIAAREAKQKAAKAAKPVKMVETDNPEYLAAVAEAKERINRIEGITDPAKKEAYLQKLLDKIAIPAKITVPATEAMSERERQIVEKHVKKYAEARIPRKRSQSIQSKKRRPETDLAVAERERKAKIKGEALATVEVDNPAYLAAVQEAKERLNRIKGLTDEDKKEAYLQKLISKITIPAKIMARREKPISAAEQKRIDDYDAQLAASRESRRKAKSVESKIRQPETEARVAERERRQYYKVHPEAMFADTSRAVMENPALVARRKEIDRRLDERAARTGRPVSDAMRKRAYSLLSKEENPEYAKAVKSVTDWMDSKSITDPEERAMLLARVNVPRQRDIPRTVQTPKGYRLDRQPKDYINLAELRNYSPESDPGAGMRMATEIVETAIQKKLFSDIGPMTAEETASRQARAQKIRDRLLKNKRPYNPEWQKAQRRDEIEELLTYPEEILSDAQRAEKSKLLARFEKGEDIYAVDSGKGSKGSGSGSGGSGGGGGGGGSPPSDDEDGGEEGGRRRGGRKTGRRREGSGTTVTATGSPVNITANTVTATGSPVNIVAAGLAVSGSGSAAGAHAAPASGASGVSGTALHAAVVAAASAPSTTPASIVAGRTLVGIGPFGPIYKTGSATTGTAATTPAAGAGAGLFGMFPGLAISGPGGGGGGGGGGLPFGVGGEFGEGGARNFGADRLLAVQQLRAARNAYEQNMGSLGGAGVGISRRELTGIAQTTTKSIIDNNDSFTELLQTANKGGYGQEADDIQAIFSSFDAPGKNIADLATDLSRLQNALVALDKAAEATQNDTTKTSEEIERAAKVRAAAAKVGVLAGFAGEEQDRAAKDVEKETNRRLSALREGLQANTTQQSLFGYTFGQDITRRGLLKGYANEITGGKGGLLYSSLAGNLQAYGVNFLGKEVRKDLRTASAADLAYTQKKLSGGDSEYQRRIDATNAALDKKGITDVNRRQRILNRVTREADRGPGVDVTTADLTSLQKTLNEEKSARNQSTLASRFSHFTQKAQQINYWATAAFNAPTAIMDAIDQAVRPALNAEKTMISARTLALSPETYGNAMQAALTQQKLFGGTLTKNIGQVTGFIPLANSYGVDINKTFNVARKLAAFDPAQGTEGAQIAIREFLSGNMSSLSRRFEISRSALSNIKQGDATEMLDSLDALLSGMGLTDRLIEDQAASMATKYDKMLGRLEAAQLSFSKIAVGALEPILNYFVGEDSTMAETARRDTTDTVLKERVAKRGDSVLTQAAHGRKVIKDLDLNSATFMQDLDTMLANANEAMVKENKLIEESTGQNVNATLYKRLNQMTPEEQDSFKADVRAKMLTGITQESAIRQTISEQTDYAGYQQFVTSRVQLGSLNTTPEMLKGQLDDANKALINKDDQEILVKNLEVLDGDTFNMNLADGLEVRGRFLGVDAPEKGSAEGLAVKKELEAIKADPNKEIRIFGGYGEDEKYGRPLVRALVRDTKTGEEYDLAAKLLAEGKVEYNDFGGYDNLTAEGKAALDRYRAIGQSAADQGIGAVNQFAASMGYGATLQPTQQAIDAVFTKKYGMNGNNIAGLLPSIMLGAGAGAAIGTIAGPWGIAGGTIIGGAIGAYKGMSLNRAAFDSDTSVEQRQEILKETEVQMKRENLETLYAPEIRRKMVVQAAEKYNNDLRKNAPGRAKNPENLVNNQDIEDIIAGTFDRKEIIRFTGRFGSQLEEEIAAATTEFSKTYYGAQQMYMDQLSTNASTLTETQQTALAMRVPSLDDPSKTVSLTERTAQALARQSMGKLKGDQAIAAGEVFYGPETAKTANESILTYNVIADKRTIEAIDFLAKKGELIEVPTGETLLKTVPVINPETGVQEFDPLTLRPKVKVEAVPQTELRPTTHQEVVRALKENDTAYINAAITQANLPENQNRSTYFEESKKYSDALMDESTKLRESLYVGLTSNAALLSFTGLGKTMAEKYIPPKMPSSVNTGTAGEAETTIPEYSNVDKALAFVSGFEIDASDSGNEAAIEQLRTTTQQNIDKLKNSAQAFEQLAASAYSFDVQFKSTFRNFTDAIAAAGDNARTIMMNMGQGNPKFAIDHITQLTGIDFKQLAMQYQILPGMQTRPSTNGQTTTYGYTQGPRGTLSFVEDFMRNPNFMSQFKESELLQVYNMATGASTQLAQRGMQQNWQMQDMAKQNARSIEDINRNGMNSLVGIHRGYVNQMMVMASQNEVTKRMSEATTQEAINIAEIPEDQRQAIDAKDKEERAQVEHLAQFNIKGYLETETGKADTEMQDLFKELETKGPANSAEYEEFWKTKIIPARNIRKEAALARSKDKSLSPEERTAAENEFIELNDNPDRAARGYQWVDDRTRERLRRAAGIKQQEKNLEGLRLQRSGLILSGQKLQEDMQKASGDPVAQQAIGQSIAENEKALRDNKDAMDTATRTINALRDLQDDWFEGSDEQWKQLLIGVESASAGAKRSVEDLAISMKTQYEEAYIKFEQSRTDMITSFARAATEIAAQVPLSIAPGLNAIMELSTSNAAATIAYNSGVEVKDASGKAIAGPEAAMTIAMDGAMKAAKMLYPDEKGDRYTKFMDAVAASARTNFTSNPKDPNNPNGGLPSGLDLYKGTYDGKDGLRVIVLNDGKIVVSTTPETSASGVVVP